MPDYFTGTYYADGAQLANANTAYCRSAAPTSCRWSFPLKHLGGRSRLKHALGVATIGGRRSCLGGRIHAAGLTRPQWPGTPHNMDHNPTRWS